MRYSGPPGGDGHVCVGVMEHGDQRAVAQPSQGMKVSSFKVNTTFCEETKSQHQTGKLDVYYVLCSQQSKVIL